ncbi:MAG: hypothetical protein J5I98_34905, partial [Phaeodactylibacter sp.]|nr:hypothetical protein [Phaeodactylibacter sp.]
FRCCGVVVLWCCGVFGGNYILDTEYADLPAARRGLAGREDTEPHRDLIINGKNSVYSVLASVL